MWQNYAEICLNYEHRGAFVYWVKILWQLSIIRFKSYLGFNLFQNHIQRTWCAGSIHISHHVHPKFVHNGFNHMHVKCLFIIALLIGFICKVNLARSLTDWALVLWGDIRLWKVIFSSSSIFIQGRQFCKLSNLITFLCPLWNS